MRHNTMIAVAILAIAMSTIACGVIFSSPESSAKEVFDQWVQSTRVPYRDVKYGAISNDGTFATVRVTAWLRQTAEATWQEHEATVQCRNVGGKWRCEGYLYFQLTQAELSRMKAAREATATAIAQQAERLQKVIKIEYVESHYGGGEDYIITAKVTNSDSQSHTVRIGASAVAPVGSHLGDGTEWWGLYFGPNSVDANSSKTVQIGIGGGGGHWGGDPTPSQYPKVTLRQICVGVSEIDGTEVSILWQQDPTKNCGVK